MTAPRPTGWQASKTSPDAPSDSPPPRLLEIPVEIAPDIEGLDALAHGPFATLEDVHLASLAAKIRDAESYDRLFAVDHAEGLLRLSHQEETARKVLSSLLGRALLADEVGPGKTVEAGLVLSEYLLRGRIESALILTPPSLIGQWREELGSKFRIDTRTTEDTAFRSDPTGFWSNPGVVVASLATARSPRHRDLVTTRSWDLVIVDEAHALKNSRTESYALVSRLTSRFLLLLTATPVENRIEELYNLVSLLRPGHLGGRSVFLRRFSDRRGRLNETATREVRALLGEVMVRNTRALSGVRLPPRFARTVLVDPDPAEGRLYEHVAAALRALGPGGRTRLLLSVLLQEAGSSPYAVRATLEKVHENPELSSAAAQALAPAIEFARQPFATGKGAALLRALDGSGDATVVFTRFRATLDFLASVLAGAGIRCERMDGNLPPPLRGEAVARCRERGGVLVSTDVGSQGPNLQFCRRIVNFDLPWNPMRIEQRIGRVHRIGQEHPVDVVNLCLAGSIEERILRILDERARRVMKRKALAGDLAARREQLRERMRARLSVRIVAATLVETTVERFTTVVRRRNLEGQVTVLCRAADSVIEGPACSACGVATLRFYLCDQRLHVLCDTCGQTGRLDAARCPSCTRRLPAPPSLCVEDPTTELHLDRAE